MSCLALSVSYIYTAFVRYLYLTPSYIHACICSAFKTSAFKFHMGYYGLLLSNIILFLLFNDVKDSGGRHMSLNQNGALSLLFGSAVLQDICHQL